MLSRVSLKKMLYAESGLLGKSLGLCLLFLFALAPVALAGGVLSDFLPSAGVSDFMVCCIVCSKAGGVLIYECAVSSLSEMRVKFLRGLRANEIPARKEE